MSLTSLLRRRYFTIFIWLKERSTVAVAIGRVNKISNNLNISGKILLDAPESSISVFTSFSTRHDKIRLFDWSVT